MPEVHAPMTGLETCFEDQLSKVPGWHSDLEKLERACPAKQTKKQTEESKVVEEAMILGR